MYRMELNYISRSGGSKGKRDGSRPVEHGFSATAAIAYRTGSIVTDYRTGVVHDYTKKARVGHSEIVPPPAAPAWALHREALWNAVESAEARKDARLAHEFIVCLPFGMTKKREIEMVRNLAQRIVEQHGIVIEFAIHDDDPKRWDGTDKGIVGRHAHVLMTTRRMTRDGFSKDKAREFSDRVEGPKTLRFWREQWALIGNKHLEKAGLEERWDHRTLEVQKTDALARGDAEKAEAFDRLPGVHLGAVATALERDGLPTFVGDLNRSIAAENAARKLARTRTHAEESLQELERQLLELRNEQETDEITKSTGQGKNDPRWAEFERDLLHVGQFQFGLGFTDIASALRETEGRFIELADALNQQGKGVGELARLVAEQLAKYEQEEFQQQIERDAIQDHSTEHVHRDDSPLPSP